MLRRWSCAGLLLGLLATLMWASTTAMEMPPAPSPSLTRLLFGSAFGAVHGGAVEVKNPVDVVMLPTGDLLVSSFMTNQVVRVPVGGNDTDVVGVPSVFARGGPYCLMKDDVGGDDEAGGKGRGSQPHGELLEPCSLLDGPWGLAVRGDVVYVASFTADMILMFDWTDSTTPYLGYIGEHPQLDCPEGLAFGPDGLLYAVSFLADEVVRYNATSGAFLGSFAKTGLAGPEGIAFTAAGDLLVASHWTDSVERFSLPAGRRLAPFAVANEARGMHERGDARPVWDAEAVRRAKRVQRRSLVQTTDDGKLPAEDEAGLYGPVGVTRGPHDDIFVSSYASGTVVRYDGHTGKRRGVFARGGGLRGPAGLTFGQGELLYVTSYDTHKLIRFKRPLAGLQWAEEEAVRAAASGESADGSRPPVDDDDEEEDLGPSPFWSASQVPL